MGLDRFVRLNKGDFIGKGPMLLAREQLGRSVPKRVGLMLEGKKAAREGCAVVLGDGRTVGGITSGSYTPTLRKSIAMAYVEESVGERVFVDIRGTTEPARIVPLPFYKRPKN